MMGIDERRTSGRSLVFFFLLMKKVNFSRFFLFFCV